MLGPLSRVSTSRWPTARSLKAALLDAPDVPVQSGAAVTLAYDPARLTVLP